MLPSSWRFWTQRLGLAKPRLLELAATSGRDYRPFLKERPGKRRRQIDRPVGELLGVQTRVYRAALRGLDYPATMHGCVPGRSLLTHVEVHVGKPCVVTLDLRSCFRSVTRDMVFSIWTNMLGLALPFANLLTSLTTWRHALPQGAPTSAALANLAMLPLHNAVAGLCAARSLHFSQWLDDFALSGAEPERSLEDVIQVIHQNGFSVTRRKTLVMRASGRQVITGLLVNRVVAPQPEFQKATENSLRDLARSTGGDEAAMCRVRGMLNHCSYINPKMGKRLREKATRWGLTKV